MDKKGVIFFFPLVFFVIFALGVFGWWKSVSKAPSNDQTAARFVVTKGASASQIANDLEKAGLVKSALAFKIYTQIKGTTKNIQAGEYTLAKDKSVAQLVTALLKGPDEVWITIPEGLRREEIADSFADGLGLTGQEATAFKAKFLSLTVSQEGYLFPDTYLFAKDTAADKVVATLLATYATKTADLGVNEDDLILASIVERESAKDAERPTVAGILKNRLDIGMGLQADATVQYVIGTPDKWWPGITRDDLKIDSKFNTYKYAGLPPAPICNPGLSAIKAAVAPAETSYLYYLHDSKGDIHYAATLPEHNANVAKYLGK